VEIASDAYDYGGTRCGWRRGNYRHAGLAVSKGTDVEHTHLHGVGDVFSLGEYLGEVLGAEHVAQCSGGATRAARP